MVKIGRKLIGILALTGLFSAIGVAGAQVPSIVPSPQASPFPPDSVVGIPETIPSAFTAEMSQAEWTAQRRHCLSIIAEVDRRHHMEATQLRALPIIPHADLLRCLDLQAEFRPPDVPPAPSGAWINPSITPYVGPPPEAAPAPIPSPQSGLPVTPDATITPASFAGGGASACPQPGPAPNVFSPTQPVDVAADVSPSQNVEMLNQGLWVFDKSGKNLNSGPESLYQFWCNTPGANGQFLASCPAGGNQQLVELTDTQIAFDPYDSKWLASTLVYYNLSNTGHLLLAISTTSSAIDVAGAWDRYDIPVCLTDPNHPNYIPDQPILGYDRDWAAIDTICLGNAGRGQTPMLSY